jgi:hypothetical protein
MILRKLNQIKVLAYGHQTRAPVLADGHLPVWRGLERKLAWRGMAAGYRFRA